MKWLMIIQWGSIFLSWWTIYKSGKSWKKYFELREELVERDHYKTDHEEWLNGFRPYDFKEAEENFKKELCSAVEEDILKCVIKKEEVNTIECKTCAEDYERRYQMQMKSLRGTIYE